MPVSKSAMLKIELVEKVATLLVLDPRFLHIVRIGNKNTLVVLTNAWTKEQKNLCTTLKGQVKALAQEAGVQKICMTNKALEFFVQQETERRAWRNKKYRERNEVRLKAQNRQKLDAMSTFRQILNGTEPENKWRVTIQDLISNEDQKIVEVAVNKVLAKLGRIRGRVK